MSDDPSVGLMFLLSLLLVIFPEIFVWSESRVLANFYRAIRVANAENNVAVKRNDALFNVD